MGFNVEIRDKDDNTVDYVRMDSEVCKLWGVEPDDKKWAVPPGKSYKYNWNEFLGLAVFLNRAFRETETFTVGDLLQGLCNFGTRWKPILDNIENNKYEIQLLHYWAQQGYKFIVTNRW